MYFDVAMGQKYKSKSRTLLDSNFYIELIQVWTADDEFAEFLLPNYYNKNI